MLKSKFLPSKNDWERLHALESRFETIRQDESRFSFINPMHLRILIILSRQILDKRPMTKEEVTDCIMRDGLQYFSNYNEIELINYSNLSKKVKDHHLKKQVRIIMDILTNMKSSHQVEVIKRSEWTGTKLVFESEKNNKKDNILERAPQKNFALYQMTAKGVIQYELGLILPLFSASLSNLNTPYRIQDAHINWGISTMGFRYRWNRNFLNDMNFIVSEFQQKVFSDIETTLGDDKDIFWELCSPQILILREYFNLNSLVKYFEGLKKEIQNKEHLKGEDNLQIIQYENKVVSNYINTIDSTIVIAKSIINYILKPYWSKTLNLKIKDLKSHLPKTDITFNF